MALELVAGQVRAGPESVQPLVAADAMPARVHAVRVRDYDRLHRARLTTLAALRTCLGPLPRADSEPVLKARALRHLEETERENPRAGPQSPGSTLPAIMMTQQTTSAATSSRSGSCPRGGSWARPGATRTAQAPARDLASLGEAFNRPQDVSH